MKEFKKFLYLDLGVITNIGETHISTFKNIDNIIIGKLKIIELINNGTLLVNNDNQYLKKIDLSHKVIKFSEKNIYSYSYTNQGIEYIYQNEKINIPIFNRYFKSYLDGIIKIGKIMKMNKYEIANGLRNIKMVSRRQEVKRYKEGYFINDSYNGNVDSIKSSVELLDSFKGENIIVTSGIIEQGKNYQKNIIKVRNILKNHNVIYVKTSDDLLIKDNQFKSIYRVSSLKDAYTLIENKKFDNILLLAKGEDIYLR